MPADRSITTRTARMDRLAELVANGLGVNEAGAMIGLTNGQTANIWRRIKRELGWQAS